MSAKTLQHGSTHEREVVNDHATAIDALTAGTQQAAGSVTGPKLATGALKKFAFTGHNLAGACTCTGAAVGDRVVGVTNITDGTSAASSFESTITVVNQIQQSAASDLSAKKFDVLLISVT